MTRKGFSKTILITVLLLFIANFGIYLAVSNNSRAVTCFTTQQVAVDGRCLYILNGKVYEKASRSSPHHGHPCEMDVTSIIPSFHAANIGYYLDPNYRGDICVASTLTPTKTPTRTPTVTPFLIFTPTPSRIPTINVSNPPSPSATAGKPGDANGDNKVDGIDYVIWRTYYGTNVSGGVSQGDFDSNGRVDGVDYVIWLANYGK